MGFVESTKYQVDDIVSFHGYNGLPALVIDSEENLDLIISKSEIFTYNGSKSEEDLRIEELIRPIKALLSSPIVYKSSEYYDMRVLCATARALYGVEAFMSAVDSTPGLEGLGFVMGHYSYKTVTRVTEIEDINDRIGFIQTKLYVGELVAVKNKPGVIRAVDGDKVNVGRIGRSLTESGHSVEYTEVPIEEVKKMSLNIIIMQHWRIQESYHQKRKE
jgi:hypothetical protein